MRYYPGCTTDAKWMAEFKESIQRWFAEQAEQAERQRYSNDTNTPAPVAAGERNTP